MSEQDGRIIILQRNVTGLTEQVTLLQDQARKDAARIEWLEKELVEVKTLGQELRAVLHTINLQALGAAVRQLQEKHRELVRRFDGRG